MWVVGVVAVIGAAAFWDDHSDWREHSAYSDAAERAERERKAREEQRRRNFEAARQEMNRTLAVVRNNMSREVDGYSGEFRYWQNNASNLAYNDFDKDYNILNNEANAKINNLAEMKLKAQEKIYRAELEKINRVLREIENARLGRKNG